MLGGATLSVIQSVVGCVTDWQQETRSLSSCEWDYLSGGCAFPRKAQCSVIFLAAILQTTIPRNSILCFEWRRSRPVIADDDLVVFRDHILTCHVDIRNIAYTASDILLRLRRARRRAGASAPIFRRGLICTTFGELTILL